MYTDKIKERINELGYKSTSEFCKFNNLDSKYVYNVLNGRIVITYENKEWKKNNAVRLSELLDFNVWDLYFEDSTLDASELYYDVNFDKTIKYDFISESIDSLIKKERIVISMRFFQERCLDDVAAHLGVTRERVRQIEAKAIRKLRHPHHADVLIDFLER